MTQKIEYTETRLGDKTVKVIEHLPHGVMRAPEMPPITDQLDEMWKAIQSLANGDPLPRGAEEMIKKIAAVKNKYPKGKIAVEVEIGAHHVKGG